MLTKLELDHDGIAEILKGGEIAALVYEAAAGVAAEVEAAVPLVENGTTVPDVILDEYVTDRAAASVTIAHPAGLAIQAIYGTLTAAAASAGLEVTEHGP